MCGGTTTPPKEGSEGWCHNVCSQMKKVFVEVVSGCSDACAFRCSASQRKQVVHPEAIAGLRSFLTLATQATPVIVLHGDGDPCAYPWEVLQPRVDVPDAWGCKAHNVVNRSVISTKIGPKARMLWLAENMRVRVKVESVADVRAVRVLPRSTRLHGTPRTGVERLCIPGTMGTPVTDILREAQDYFCVVQSNGTRSEMLVPELRACAVASGRQHASFERAQCEPHMVITGNLCGRYCLGTTSPSWRASTLIELAYAYQGARNHVRSCAASADWIEMHCAVER